MESSVSPDVNFESVYGQKDVTLGTLDLLRVDGSKYASILKISHCTGVKGGALAVAQGTENALDLDFCEDVKLSGTFGLGPVQGDQVITIKGGTRNYAIKAILYSRGHAGYEVAIGNWFDQSYRIGGKGSLNLLHVDGGKVRVAIGWVIPFSTKLSFDCEYMPWESLKLKLYWVAKYFIRLCLRIPKGTKGPAWF